MLASYFQMTILYAVHPSSFLRILINILVKKTAGAPHLQIILTLELPPNQISVLWGITYNNTCDDAYFVVLEHLSHMFQL